MSNTLEEDSKPGDFNRSDVFFSSKEKFCVACIENGMVILDTIADITVILPRKARLCRELILRHHMSDEVPLRNEYL